jgi:hypothetical protein
MLEEPPVPSTFLQAEKSKVDESSTKEKKNLVIIKD